MLSQPRSRRAPALAILGLLVVCLGSPAPVAAAAVTPTLRLGASIDIVDNNGIGDSGLVTFDVHLAVPSGSSVSVANRAIHLQSAPSNSPGAFTAFKELTTNAIGSAAVINYEPEQNRWYRAVFDGTDEIAAAISPSVRVLVRYTATIGPGTSGTVRSVRKGTEIQFRTTVSPVVAGAARGHVSWEVWGTRGGRLQRLIATTSDPSAGGVAALFVKFTATGRYRVRSRALGTATNATSDWTPWLDFNVR